MSIRHLTYADIVQKIKIGVVTLGLTRMLRLKTTIKKLIIAVMIHLIDIKYLRGVVEETDKREYSGTRKAKLFKRKINQ